VAVAGSVGEALSSATDAIAAAGAESPRLDAELLLEAATGADRARLAAAPEMGVDAAAARDFGAMVRRRVMREPIAYIVGSKGFRRIELAVDGRVLIPRPETELLVELALELRPATMLDVGTGSGAIALAVADELTDVAVTATDTSLHALAVAQANRDRLGLGERVELAYGTLPAGRFDLVLANLPYVSEEEWPTLAPEIREFEPREALTSGPTGLEAIDALLGAVAVAPEPPRTIGLEHGLGQSSTVAELVRRAGFERVEARRDLAGIERVVVGWM
jgi:release factor glutamine methyltransferase